jgi:hypothetical protein
MITVDDLRHPDRQSGFRNVQSASAGPNGGGKGDYWRAISNRGAKGKTSDRRWRGPLRRNPEDAAQDAANFLSGVEAATPASLKSAGHQGKREKIDDPEVQAALGVLRDAQGEREGKQGYVYLIGEEFDYDTAFKIGFSTNPEARVAELQTGNPRRLVLLGKTEGTREDERALHEKYMRYNVLQEWFRANPALLLEFNVDKPERI